MSLWLVIYVEHDDSGWQFYHPLCICAHETVAQHYIQFVENRFDRNLLAYMELPYYG